MPSATMLHATIGRTPSARALAISASLSAPGFNQTSADALLHDLLDDRLADFRRNVEGRQVDRPRHVEHGRVRRQALRPLARAD